MIRRCATVGLFALCMISMLCSVQAQSTFGSIVGVVNDPGERVVPGAEIKLTSLDDQSATTTTSDSDGAFQFMNVKAGRYEISVHSAGFASFKLQSVQLEARQTLREEISLKVASASEIIEVGDTAPMMNDFAMHPVRKLPLVIRTPKQFHTLILLLEKPQRFPSQSAGT